MSEHILTANEKFAYNEGVLVEAVKGDEVIRGRIEGKYPHIGSTGLTVSFYMERGFTITIIEKAAPKLPTEPGVYADRNGATWALTVDGEWWLVNRQSVESASYSVQFAPFTRLEPVPVTAKRILVRLSQELHQTDWKAAEKTILAVFEEFGPTP